MVQVTLSFFLLLVTLSVKLVDSPKDKHQEMSAVSNKMEMQCFTTNYSYLTPPPGKVTLDALNTIYSGTIFAAGDWFNICSQIKMENCTCGVAQNPWKY